MGRVLTDHRKNQKRKKHLRRWRGNNRERYNAYMRGYNKRNNQAEYMREYRKRQRLRMFEDAFERLMDKMDGLVGFVAPPEKWTKKRVISWSTKKGNGENYSEDFRARKRINAKRFYENHRDEILQRHRQQYHEKKAMN